MDWINSPIPESFCTSKVEDIKNFILVGGFNPLEKYSSVGMMIPNIYGKIKTVPNHQPVIEGSLEIKFPTIWADEKAQPGRSSDMEKVRREKIREGKDQRGRKLEERRCRSAKR